MRPSSTLLSLFLVSGACGGAPDGGGSAAPGAGRAPAAMVAGPAGPDDVQVATVDGRPVWASCLVAQAARGARTRQAALDECIAFELLAQHAEKRGHAALPEVREETRRALVSRLVAEDFERKYQKPDDLRPQVDAMLAKARPIMNQPEFRASAYARVNVAPEAAGDPAKVEAARALAEKLHARLADETGLTPHHLQAAAERLGKEAGVELEFKTTPFFSRGQTVPEYDAALFAIPEVGRVSPVFRTQWGFDLVLLTELSLARQYTTAEVEPSMFSEARRQQFKAWTDELAKTNGWTIAKLEGALEAAEALEGTP